MPEQEWWIGCKTENEYLPVNSIDAIYLRIRMSYKDMKGFIDLGKANNLEVYEIVLYRI